MTKDLKGFISSLINKYIDDEWDLKNVFGPTNLGDLKADLERESARLLSEYEWHPVTEFPPEKLWGTRYFIIYDEAKESVQRGAIWRDFQGAGSAFWDYLYLDVRPENARVTWWYMLPLTP
jgi:hypothetical protein